MRYALLALGLLALPAHAQGVDVPTAPRQRFVTVFGNEKCPKSADPNEIVICARRPADEQFRIPTAVRNTPFIARKDDVSARSALVSRANGADPACSAVGTSGQFGCSGGLNILGAARTARDVATGSDPVADVPPR